MTRIIIHILNIFKNFEKVYLTNMKFDSQAKRG